METAIRLVFDPLIPVAFLGGLGLAVIVLWTFYLLRRGRAALLRALGLSVLGLALANPLYIREEREPLKDIVAVIVDRSESMRFRGRTETAEAALSSLRASLEGDETIELRIVETDPEADSSDVIGALQSSLSDAPRDRIGGAVLITDGQVHDIPNDPAQLADIGPVHALIVGGEDEIDRRIEIEQAPSFGIVDTPVEFRIRVDDPAARSVRVAISVNGKERRAEVIPVGEPTTLRIDLDRRGDNLVVLQVDGIPNELTLANNLASTRVSGVQDRLRVLLVTGQPHAGARAWRDLLKADPSVDLVHFTILRPPQKSDATPTEEIALINFPRNQLFREKLDEFDLVIFDQELRAGVLELPYLDRVARYVENGGALLIASGPPYPDSQMLYTTPLAGVLPGQATGEVVATKFVPQLTELGKRHSVTATLPRDGWGPWMRYMKVAAGDSEAILRAPDGAPLLLLDRVEEGRVASMMSDQIWLWARGYEGGGPYAELIRRLAHWLMKEPELEEELLELSAGADAITADLRTLSDRPPPFTLKRPDGSEASAEWSQTGPGAFRASVPAGEIGLFEAKTGDLSAVAVRGPAHPREYADLRAGPEKLQPLATTTLAGTFRLGSDGRPDMPDVRRIAERGNAVGDGWLGLRRREAYAVRATESISLLPGVVGMTLSLAFLMLAWRREGR